ncbi:MAG: divergent PAP2 family protein [Caldilineaceae bacterium]
MGALFSNSALWIPVSIAFFVQLFKFLWEWTRTGSPDLRILSRSGGMPSSHTAMVVSLATVLGIEYGLDSSLFAIGVVLSVIVMYDATGVRQQSGKHAKVSIKFYESYLAANPLVKKS